MRKALPRDSSMIFQAAVGVLAIVVLALYAYG
jgi:hypothetical protein